MDTNPKARVPLLIPGSSGLGEAPRDTSGQAPGDGQDPAVQV
jgi:hypothetical protein